MARTARERLQSVWDFVRDSLFYCSVRKNWRLAGARPLPLIDALGGGQRRPGPGWARGQAAVQRRCVAGHRSSGGTELNLLPASVRSGSVRSKQNVLQNVLHGWTLKKN